jgi:RND family efflux transporter MFP subunit
VLGLTALAVAVLLWQWHRPRAVTVVQPTLTTITESLATTGRVSGTTETFVGTQATGIIDRLLVREGDRVSAGEQLAVLKNNVAEAQVAQAQAALNTARAQCAQVTRAPLRSEVEMAAEHVRQARAQVAQQRTAAVQAEHAVAQAHAQLRQLEAEQELAVKQDERSARLVARGFIAQTEFDQTHANRRVAEGKVWAQQQALAAAQANVRALQAGVEAAQANVRAQEAQLQTVQTGSRPEDIQVAWARVEEAERALHVARQQATNAMVTAPFAGTVTAVYAEVGQSVGTQGVLKLVSRDGEIRVDVDEGHLADLSVGQEVILSSSTFRDSVFRGTVSKIAAAVDEARGTVTVTIVPMAPPDWLRPGQTVHVNILTHPAVQRLLVPAAALIRIGDRSGVLVVEHGQARQKTVTTRPPTEQGVPVLAGLTVHDRVITNPQGIRADDAVRIREAIGEGKACLPLSGAQPC